MISISLKLVGSEGVTAPADADHPAKNRAVVVLIGANDDGWAEGDHMPCWRPGNRRARSCSNRSTGTCDYGTM